MYNLKELEWNDVGWIDLDEDRDMWWTLVHAVMTRQLPYKVVNVLAS
jgi:hypothetical protein